MTNPEKKSLFDKIKSILKNIKRKLFKDKTVALVKLDGIIMDSESFPVARKLIKTFKEIEKREIKALVFRVNSPGGTVGASQEIYNALQQLKEKGTKVIVSYGDVSASGGVYVSCGADKIVANPGTITGSIGVIISSSNLKKLYEKIGFESEVIKSGPYKDILSSHRSLSEEEKQILQSMIDDAYSQFVEVVSKGRNLDPLKVREFADGRIFTGQQALELGMVDELGSLKDAINLAAELVEIEGEPHVVDMSPKKSRVSQMMNSKMQQVELALHYSGMPLWLMPKSLNI